MDVLYIFASSLLIIWCMVSFCFEFSYFNLKFIQSLVDVTDL